MKRGLGLGVPLVAALSAVFISGAGCQDGEDVDVVVADANDMGVVEVEIHRSKTDKGEPLVEAIGLDARGAELGRATLLITDVVWPPPRSGQEPDPDAQKQPGSVLTLTFGDHRQVVTNADRTAHSKFIPDSALRRFAQLPAVEAAIEDAVGLTFGSPPTVRDAAYTHGLWTTPYGGGDCGSESWPWTDGYIPNCSEEYASDGYGGYQFTAGQGPKLFMRYRYYGCRRGNGDTYCGMGHPGGNCAYGPCGGSPADISAAYNNGSQVAFEFYNYGVGQWQAGGDSTGFDISGGFEEPVAYGSNLLNQGWGATSGAENWSSCGYTKGCGYGTGPIP